MKSEEEYKKELHEEFRKDIRMSKEEYTDDYKRLVEGTASFQLKLINKTLKGLGKELKKEFINIFKIK